MGFGSYDESEQEQPDENDEATGEDMTGEFKQSIHDGSDSVKDSDTNDMMKHL